MFAGFLPAQLECAMKNDLRLSEAEAKAIAEGLTRVLSDTFMTYLKTHGFHWNVEGPRFHSMHEMLEDQYKELWEAIDDIAERIRALGYYAPAALADYREISQIVEERTVPAANRMLEILADDHETTVRTIRGVYSVAEEAGDQATTNLFDDRLSEHEEAIWMLRAMARGEDVGRASPIMEQFA